MRVLSTPAANMRRRLTTWSSATTRPVATGRSNGWSSASSLPSRRRPSSPATSWSPALPPDLARFGSEAARPGAVGQLDGVEAAVAVGVPDLVVRQVERRRRHRVVPTGQWQRVGCGLVEVRDLARMQRVVDVEDPKAGQDEAARDDAGVDRARHVAVVRGVALDAVLRTRVVLLVTRPRLRLVDLEAQVRDDLRVLLVVDADDAPGADRVRRRVAAGVARVLVELDEVLVTVDRHRVAVLRDRDHRPGGERHQLHDRVGDPMLHLA